MGRVIYFKDNYIEVLTELKKNGQDVKTPILAIRYDRYLKQSGLLKKWFFTEDSKKGVSNERHKDSFSWKNQIG